MPSWDFTGAHLTRASFSRANCTRTIFESAVLVRVDFSRRILTSVKFIRVDLYEATFYQVPPASFIFAYARVEKVNFTGVGFHGGHSKPPRILFSKSNMAYSIFVRAV